MLLTDPEVESSLLISSDEGATYQKYRLNFYILSLLFHPEQEDWILAYSHDQKVRERAEAAGGCSKVAEDAECYTRLWLRTNSEECMKFTRREVDEHGWCRSESFYLEMDGATCDMHTHVLVFSVSQRQSLVK